MIICDVEGVPIRSNLSADDEMKFSALVSQIAMKANSVVRGLDEWDELTFLRIRSKNHEIMVAPDKDFILIVIQNPNV